jgi:hypothetical protein
MYAENYLYFAADVTADLDGLMLPVSRVVGLDYSAATKTRIYFKGTPEATTTTGRIDIAHANISTDSDIHGKVMKALVKAMSNPAKGKIITIADAVNSVYASELDAYAPSDVDPAVITE